MNPPTEQLIRDYLNRLSLASRGKLGATERQSLLDRTRARIEAECGGTSQANAAVVRKALAGLGDPIAIVELEHSKISVGSAQVEGGASSMQAEPDRTVDSSETGDPETGPEVRSDLGGAVPAPRDAPEAADASEPDPGPGEFDLDRHGLDEHGHDRPGTGQHTVLDTDRPPQRGTEGASRPASPGAASPGPARTGPRPQAGRRPAAPATPAAPVAPAVPAVPAQQPSGSEQARLDRRARLERELTASPPPRPGMLSAAIANVTDVVRRHTVEFFAVLLLGVGGAIYPPIWLVGAALALPSKKWDIRDKFVGITMPIVLVVIGTVLVLVLGGQRGSLGSYAFEAWLGAERISRVVALLGSGYLLWGLRRGRRTPRLPPWNVPHKLG